MSFDRWHRVAGGALLALLPLLSGCYEFDQPLGPPEKGAIDRALVGSWKCVSSPADDMEEVVVEFVRFDSTQYLVEWTAPGKPGVMRFRAYSTRVGAESLLNAREMKADPSKQGWVYTRYRIDGPKMTLSIVNDKEVGGTDKAATSAVRRRVADEKIYEELMACTRQEEKEEK